MNPDLIKDQNLQNEMEAHQEDLNTMLQDLGLICEVCGSIIVGFSRIQGEKQYDCSFCGGTYTEKTSI